MKIRRKHIDASRRGMAMMAVIVATFSVVSVLAVMLTLASFSNDLADTERRDAEAHYLALGAVEAAKRELVAAVANWQAAPAEGLAFVGDETVGYTIESTGLESVQTDPVGIQTLINGFEIRAIGESFGSRIPAHRIVNVEATPIFQFAVFYNNDLEIFPGANMRLNGRVHTNSNMYLGSNATLTCDTNYVRAVGSIYRNRKDSPSESPGTVNIRRWVDNPFDPTAPSSYFRMASQSQMEAMGIDTVSGYDSRYTTGFDSNGDGDFFDANEWLPWGPGALTYWGSPDAPPPPLDLPVPGSGPLPPEISLQGHTVMDSAHGLSELVVPSVGSIAMFKPSPGGNYAWDSGRQRYVPVAAGTGTHAKGFFHEQSDLSIIVYANGTWDAFDGSGSSVKFQLTDVVRTKTLFDARQGGNVSVLEVDVRDLNSSGAFPANGLIYAAHYGMGTGTSAKGIELVNGAELRAPLTVVSEGSIYVQGNYNTQNKKGAAVIADAVNLLSNSWNDTKRAGTLPEATSTTFNLAMVTGNHNTTYAHYNGGFENLPRFHENWSGDDCRINGAFVNTWTSRYATGSWVYGGDRYTAPNRIWAYDPMFNTVALLPPFTPMVVSARDVVSW